jgi:hypothetical protein
MEAKRQDTIAMRDGIDSRTRNLSKSTGEKTSWPR